MATHQSGLILILCSGLALLWSTQSQLIRTANSCDDIICPGGYVQYDCSVPISGSVVVWRMMPECERNGEQPDIIFLFGDPQLSIVCNDGRKIMVQGMTTSNGNRFVSTINVTNITSSQTVACLFDDGSEEETVGNDTVYTTAPVPNVTNIDATTDLVLITLDQQSLKENCTLIDYAVSSSTECGVCHSIVDSSISCTNAQVGTGCTLTIETMLCRMRETVLPINITTMAPQLFTTTASNAQAGSLSSGVVAVIIILILAVIVVIVVICIIVCVKCKKSKDTFYGIFRKRTKPVVQGLIEEQMEMEEHQATFSNEEQKKNLSLQNCRSVSAAGQDGTEESLNKTNGPGAESSEGATNDVAKVDSPVSVQDKSDQSDEVTKVMTPVADSLKDTAASDNKVEVDRPYSLQDKIDQNDDSYSAIPVANSSIDTAAATDNKINVDHPKNVQDKSNQSDGSYLPTPVADSSKHTAATTANKVKVKHSHGTNSTVSEQFSTAYETSANGPGLIVTGSATMKSASAVSSTMTSESSTYVVHPPTTSFARSDPTKPFSSLSEAPPVYNPVQRETVHHEDMTNPHAIHKYLNQDQHEAWDYFRKELAEERKERAEERKERAEERKERAEEKKETKKTIERLEKYITDRDERIRRLEDKIGRLGDKVNEIENEKKAEKERYNEEIRILRNEKKDYMEELIKAKQLENDPEMELCEKIARLKQIKEEGTTTEVREKTEAEIIKLEKDWAKVKEKKAAEIKEIKKKLEQMKREDGEI